MSKSRQVFSNGKYLEYHPTWDMWLYWRLLWLPGLGSAGGGGVLAGVSRSQRCC